MAIADYPAETALDTSDSFEGDAFETPGSLDAVEAADPAIFEAIRNERRRQVEGLELIASENYTSEAIQQAQGSVLTNKYAEGYPGRRYYGGCEFIDDVENLARDRAVDLFGHDNSVDLHANVQPHSGSQANAAVYMTVCEPGDTVLAMDLNHGGHLTHGMRLNFSGKLYNAVHYGVRESDHRIDMDAVAALAREHKPKMIIAGFSAYPRELEHAKFAEIAAEVGAKLMVDMAHYSGLAAARVHGNPAEFADFVTSTTHKTLRGPRSGMILCKSEYAKDVDRSVFPGQQGGPLCHVMAGKAICYAEARRPEFRRYIEQVCENAQALGETLTAGGATLVSGGTDNHLLLVDVTALGLGGKLGEHALDAAGITANKNMIPFDSRKPMDPSGVRFGTAALTTRGMDAADMRRVGEWILEVLKSPEDESVLSRVRAEVREFAGDFPVPGING